MPLHGLHPSSRPLFHAWDPLLHMGGRRREMNNIAELVMNMLRYVMIMNSVDVSLTNGRADVIHVDDAQRAD